MQKHLTTAIIEQQQCHNQLRSTADFPQTPSVRRAIGVDQRAARELGGLAFYQRFKVALHTPLFSSSISWVTITEYLMRTCGMRSGDGCALTAAHRATRADYTAPSKQHNTASTLHLMIPRELRRIARLPVLFLIGAFVLQWLAFSLRRIASVRGLSCFQTCLSWGVMQSARRRQSGKRANTFPTDHADVSVCPRQLAEQGRAVVAWWLSFWYDEAYDPSS